MIHCIILDDEAHAIELLKLHIEQTPFLKLVGAKSRSAIGNNMDSYTGTLDYLIKRTPFGTKSR